MDDIPGIAILQYLPHDYIKLRTTQHKHLSKMDYVIGRAMFESDNVPPAWRSMINENVDELWVPTLFHVKSFSTHGVTIPVVNIGEGFDPVRFNREITQSDRTGLFPGCNAGDYIFITVSQYIGRKGFNILFEAYVKAFGAKDKVCLAVRASGLDELEFKNPANLRTCRVDRLSGESYTALFKSGDAFISASHGEGWGRTNQQAMAMGLPTILPLWGGITGYATKDTIIPIIVEELEQAFPDQGKNWLMGKERLDNKWAKIEVSRVVDAMRWVYKHQDAARVIGRKAEQHMRDHYTRSKIADNVLNRTSDIFSKIEDKY